MLEAIPHLQVHIEKGMTKRLPKKLLVQTLRTLCRNLDSGIYMHTCKERQFLKKKIMLDINGLEEYNNVGALFGLDGLDGEELLGALGKLDPVKRAKVIGQIANTGAPSRGSRGR